MGKRKTGQIRSVCRRDAEGRKLWYFDVVAGNGEVTATSRAYGSRGAALEGIDLLDEHWLAVIRYLGNLDVPGEG